jgi:hypothetical protein
MLIIILVSVFIGIGAVLGLVVGAAVRLLLKLPSRRTWIDALLGASGTVLAYVWRGLAEAVIWVFSLGSLDRNASDQYLLAGWILGMLFPALRQGIRFWLKRSEKG